MAAKKKAKKIQTKSKQATSKKVTPTKKTGKKKLATSKKVTPTKKTSVKKQVIKGRSPKKHSTNEAAHKAVTVKSAGRKSKGTGREPTRGRSQTEETPPFSPTGPAEGSGGQSGDLQGLSSVEGADSESVVELLEEGNSFEAAVVAGVENAGNEYPREVRTHEVSEDDVPDEYLDRE